MIHEDGYRHRMTSPFQWTADAVGRRLVDAFRRLPDHPVMSRPHGGFVERGGADIDAFAWPERYLADVRDRRLVMVWANCQASGASFAARCRDLGWSSLNPDRKRRSALAAIAAGLNRDDPARSMA